MIDSGDGWVVRSMPSTNPRQDRKGYLRKHAGSVDLPIESLRTRTLQKAFVDLKPLMFALAALIVEANPTSALPPAGERISRSITRVHNAVLARFESVCEEEQKRLFTLIQDNLPFIRVWLTFAPLSR
ncbi:nad-specific glutamate [Plasmopara halstedii]|uniref:Nad-specific glutamate n=1 Tax=Plasmopara halstedii TaxID=4781 RepID=A0A0P1B3H2_PLAHL|nr:nad-specific glutamate [Plasmopara halstedii]CEG48638.1 nad-specific glutamate [Plasmopara halstedii]|eukprot:XP_024585007.1 nad-specific glutamate [Plasmopara halstedii]